MSSASTTRLKPAQQLAHADLRWLRAAWPTTWLLARILRCLWAVFRVCPIASYEPGDSIRQFDWRLTAKTGKPYVKQYETLKRIAVYLVIDTSSSMSVSSIPFSKHDMAIWMASAIGLVAQRRLSPVAVVGGGQRETRLEPSLAQGDLWRAIEPLRMHARAESTQLAERVRSLEPRLSRSSILVVISDLHDPQMASSLKHAAQKHDVIVLHVEDQPNANRYAPASFVVSKPKRAACSWAAVARDGKVMLISSRN